MRLLFVHGGFQTFARYEYELLKSAYNVKEANLRHKLKLVTVIKSVMAVKSVYNSDLVFCYFASLHSFLPIVFAKLLKKKSTVVVGGYDVANMPDIGYGLMRGGMRRGIGRFVVRTILRLADLVLTFSKFSATEAIVNGRADPRKVKPLYLGFEFSEWLGGVDKEDLVITIGGAGGNNQETVKRLGIETFVRSASYLPQVRFSCIGKWEDNTIEYLRSIATPNVEFTGFVTEEKLKEYLARAKVYVQASAHEGFGRSVAEAMLSECIPIVTKKGSLPEVVGATGLYVPVNDPKATAEKVEEALNLGIETGRKARQRIMQEFPMKTHKEELYEIINSLCLEGSHAAKPTEKKP